MKRIFLFALIPVAIVAFLALGGWAVQALWNAVMPKLADGIHTIDFYTAVGLLLLCRILLGSWGKGRGPKGAAWGRGGAMRGLKDLGKADWGHLNPDEKSKLRAYWRSRCGTKPAAEPTAGPVD